MITRSLITLLGLALLTLQGCTIYPSHSRTAVAVHDHNAHLRLSFSDYERRYIQQYYGHQKPVRYQPPKRHKVPPEYTQRYHRYKALPNQYRPQPISRDLNRRLTPLPKGYSRVMIGKDMAIMNQRTRVLSDIMWQVR